MRIHLVVAVALLTLGVASASGQHHTAGYFGVTWAASGTSYGVRTDLMGNVTSMQLGSTSHYACALAADNQRILVPDSASRSIWLVDPTSMSITGTFITAPPLASIAGGLEYDHEGNLYVVTGTQVWKIDQSKAMTVVAAASFPLATATIDVFTGDLLVASGSLLRRVNLRTGALTQIGSGFVTRYGDLAQDGLTGDIYAPTCCGNAGRRHSMHRLQSGSSVASIWLSSTTLLGANGLQMDRLSAGQPRIVSGSFRSQSVPVSGGFWQTDLATKNLTKIAAFNTATVADVVMLDSRNIVTTETGTGRYTVDLSFPGEGTRGYVLAASLTGITPALPLADGRLVPLVFDNLAFLSIRGLLSPFFTNTIGALSQGRGQANIDVSSLLPGIQGVPLWLVAATIDPSAPLGIATISDPHLLRID